MTGIEDLQKRVEMLRKVSLSWPHISTITGQNSSARTKIHLNSRNVFTCFCKSSIPVIFSESAIGQYFFDHLMCAQYYNNKTVSALEADTTNYLSQICGAK